MTRREAVKRTVFFSAALLTPEWLSRLAAHPVTQGEDGIHLLAMADFGTGNADQVAVAQAMASYAAKLGSPLAAVLAIGDNFYKHLDVARFGPHFEEMYLTASLGCPFYVAAGNHDYGTKYDPQPGKLQIQFDYAQNNPASRWKFPRKWYAVELPGSTTPLVKIIVLDSNYGEDALTPDEEVAQEKFLADELAKTTQAPWTWVMAHHPMYSDAPRGDKQIIIDRWGPLLRAHPVSLYLCGHDHNLQHLEIEGYNNSFIVTGGGGAHLTSVAAQPRLKFSDPIFSFTHLQVTTQAITLQFIDTGGRRLYGFSRSLRGEITPLSPAAPSV